MTITFTNAECTTARVTCGILWWKRVAEVERPDITQWAKSLPNNSRWRYRESGEWLSASSDDYLGIELDIARKETLAARIESNNWQRPGKLPRATVVKP